MELDPEMTKWKKEKSFLSVRLLLKDELIDVLRIQSLLIGTGIESDGLEPYYKKLKIRNDNNTHVEKIKNNKL